MKETVRPFRFGMVFTGATEPRKWRELARRLEGEGFSTLLVADHYDNPMACGILQIAAADATTTLRVGSYVYNNDFRHPALLAKEAATIDVMSGGRLELGIGAGWHKGEYDQTGITFDPGPVRVSRLEEAIEIMTRLWDGERVTFTGQHYRIDDLEGSPLPVQRPLPMLIGGGGPRMLRLAARRADTVALVPRSLPGGGLDPVEFEIGAFEARIASLEDAVREAGRADSPPERGVLVFQMYRDLSEVAPDDWIVREGVATSPYALVGDTVAMADALIRQREAWDISYVVCFDSDLEKMLPVARRLAGT
jgi:probable F420-dependent oxidoreductase